jgi:hypothetical protein
MIAIDLTGQSMTCGRVLPVMLPTLRGEPPKRGRRGIELVDWPRNHFCLRLHPPPQDGFALPSPFLDRTSSPCSPFACAAFEKHVQWCVNYIDEQISSDLNYRTSFIATDFRAGSGDARIGELVAGYVDGVARLGHVPPPTLTDQIKSSARRVASTRWISRSRKAGTAPPRRIRIRTIGR